MTTIAVLFSIAIFIFVFSFVLDIIRYKTLSLLDLGLAFLTIAIYKALS